MKIFAGILIGFVIGWGGCLILIFGLLEEDDIYTTARANHKGHIELVIGYNPDLSPKNNVSEGLYDTKLWSVEKFLNSKTTDRNEQIIVTFNNIDDYMKARGKINELSKMTEPN